MYKLEDYNIRMSDSDDSAVESAYGLQKYSLVRFIHRGRKRHVESVDIVPSKWLDYDKSKARCITKFMAGPYNEKDLQFIHELVIRNADAPEDWPTFSIEQVGRAMTYKEGLKKIKKLETDDHALTLESEDSASEAQRQLTLAVKRQKLQAEAKDYNSRFSSPSANDNQSRGIKDTSDNTRQAARQERNIEEKEGLKKQNYGYSKVPCGKPSCGSPSFSQRTCSAVFKSSSSEHYVAEKSDELVEMVSANESSSISDELQSVVRQDKVLLISNVLLEPPKSAVNQAEAVLVENELSLDENMYIDVPIYPNDVDCKTPFEHAVIMRLEQMSMDLAELKMDMAHLKIGQTATTTFLVDKKVVARCTTDLERKYEVKIPLTTYEDFQAFDEKLKSDMFFKRDVYTELKSYVDKDYKISKSIVKMLKRLFTKDLAKQFTAIRVSVINKNKYKFRPTELCMMIEALLMKSRQQKSLAMSPDDFNSSLTDVLTNVAKWK